ncbi:haloacid dehalogenase, type II [Aspergillus homomorphus CBS 101889]|uniref:Haloacid dehalogenase n=1 Tax=Aspergillus homomorphus (strain CBS 101889) TaxID=1450537 RepID=A0A395HNL1_ASPHC|nr:haloacid dehalogenase [Aspergillus homomorphus CBS 101889]RAL09542.1 haloacid dehalogenase [Aspergillus homomorphus CBS 101889]
MAKIVVAFDIYGTLLSFDAATHELEQHFRADGNRARTVAQTWRRYQLEYTWRLNSMGRYLPFNEVTRNALLHALDDTGSFLRTQETDEVLAAYNRLQPFPDVEEALTKLMDASTVLKPVVFSNGTADMVKACIDHAPAVSRFAGLTEIISAHEVQQYKPAQAAYRHLREKACTPDTKEVWLISANPFDIAGALSAGIKTIWVDRSQAGWTDRTLPDVVPTAVVSHLTECVDIILKR